MDGTVMYTTNGASNVRYDPVSFLAYWYQPADANLRVVPMRSDVLSAHSLANFHGEETKALFEKMDQLEQISVKNEKSWRQAWRGVLKEAVPSHKFIQGWEKVFGDDNYIKPPYKFKQRRASHKESEEAVKLVSSDHFNSLYKRTALFGSGGPSVAHPTVDKIAAKIYTHQYKHLDFSGQTKEKIRGAISAKVRQIVADPDAFDTSQPYVIGEPTEHNNPTPITQHVKRTIGGVYKSLKDDTYRGYYYDGLIKARGKTRTTENILDDIIREQYPKKRFTDVQLRKMKDIINKKNTLTYAIDKAKPGVQNGPEEPPHFRRAREGEPRPQSKEEVNELISRAQARLRKGSFRDRVMGKSPLSERLQQLIARLEMQQTVADWGQEEDYGDRAASARELELLLVSPEEGRKQQHSDRLYKNPARDGVPKAPPNGVPKQRWEQGERIPGYAPPGHEHSAAPEQLSAAHAATQVGRNKDYGDYTLNNAQQVHTGKPTLRPRFGSAGVQNVIPSVREQVRSDLEFDMFSVVGPGYSEGRDNKLFIQQQQREHNILPVGQKFQPNEWDGPLNYQHPMPWQWQMVKDMQHVKSYIDQTMAEKHRAMLTAIKFGEGTAAGFGRDVPEEPLRVSSSGLPRDIRSPFEPVIHNSHPMRPAVDPAGYLEHKQRGMKRPFSAMRDPFKREHYRDNNGPTLNKRRSLEVVLP